MAQTTQRLRTAILLVLFSSGSFSALVEPLVSAQASNVTAVQMTICGLISTISSILGIIAIFLFVLGAILYGVATIFPAAGNLKGSTQGWGVGMMVGGVIAVVLYLLSSFIIYRIASFSNSTKSPIPAIVQVNCNDIKSAASASPSAAPSAGSAAAAQVSPASPSSLAYCQTGSKNVSLSNGNFSAGTYGPWQTSGPGFGSSPIPIISADQGGDYYNRPWSNYNGAYLATTYNPSGSQQGTLTYPSFYADEPYLNFKIASPKSSLLYVELLVNGQPFTITYYNSTNGQGYYPLSTFANASISLVPVMCSYVGIRVVQAGSSSPGNFIAVTGFYLSSSSAATPGIIVNSTVI